MKYTILFIATTLMLFSCKEEPKSWQHSKTILVEGVNPIGIAHTPNGIWLSDGDHNRVVRIDENGNVEESIDSLDRPMHISSDGYEISIPQYGNDVILRWKENIVKEMAIEDSLDAPAGIWRTGEETAIADFYNNRILYSKDNLEWISFGKEGKAEGDFYYPTDVQITKDAIWVADAYNNRVQVFDKSGNFQKVIGVDQKMNAATGIFVSETALFVTDFENDRVLVFDHEGTLLQEIKEHIAKPTDLILIDSKLYVANYRTSELNVFEWKTGAAMNEEAHSHEDHEH
ncbi:NHL repeat-containing protein [Jejudonia soesokkakensis]|uniref:NHL repeat-containing protein n=1 Tax=Jejudonia soesokkakensis TaxID=1323432 RepID=A0ABW2MPK4_9FLAO